MSGVRVGQNVETSEHRWGPGHNTGGIGTSRFLQCVAWCSTGCPLSSSLIHGLLFSNKYQGSELQGITASLSYVTCMATGGVSEHVLAISATQPQGLLSCMECSSGGQAAALPRGVEYSDDRRCVATIAMWGTIWDLCGVVMGHSVQCSGGEQCEGLDRAF